LAPLQEKEMTLSNMMQAVRAATLMAALLMVHPPLPAQDMPDATVQSIVQYRLNRDGLINKNQNIKVSVNKGVVTLDGTVSTAAGMRRAEQLTRTADGVQRVVNNLRIAAVDDISDQQLAERIGSNLRSSVYFDIFDWVEGSVNNGVVVLKGWVREPWRRNEYMSLAESVTGVRDVQNQVEVLPTSSFDDNLRIGIARAIYGHPTFLRYANRSLPPIHIVVRNGEVWLKGAVNSELEKTQAGMLANQSSAFRVHNDLTVDRKS
jgi:hyperosmotically inducible periplasmic protein